MNQARRYNKGKNRLGLIPTDVLEIVAEVYTKGAEKYSLFDEQGNLIDDGANNWKKGLSMTSVLDSLKRHLTAWEQGEDYDPDLGTHHLGNAIWNLITILWYQKHRPELDDRDLWWKKPLKSVWLDLDGIVIDFESHFLNYLGLPVHHPTDWNDFRFRKNFQKIMDDDHFWLTCPALIKPEQIAYPITGYCTSRPCSIAIIEQWLEANGFPSGEIINVGMKGNKAEALQGKCDVMVDDSIRNFIDLNSSGVTCYLMTRPHNVKYNVGMMRVNTIEEFVNKLK